MKKSSVFTKKRSLYIYLSSIKTKLAINFLKKKLLHLPEKRAGAERAKHLTLCRADDSPVSHPINLRKQADNSPMSHPFYEFAHSFSQILSVLMSL